MDWIPIGTSTTYDPTPSRSDMLEWEEAVKMATEGTNNRRDEALIKLRTNSGPEAKR